MMLPCYSAARTSYLFAVMLVVRRIWPTTAVARHCGHARILDFFRTKACFMVHASTCRCVEINTSANTLDFGGVFAHTAPAPLSLDRTGEVEIRRLLMSPFVHGDDMHLYYNMASFLLKGVSLELTMGTQAFAGLLSFSLLASQTLMMLSAWVLLVVFDVPSPMHACTVGFSGVLFALKYVLSRRSPGVTSVSGWAQHYSFVCLFLIAWFIWEHAVEKAVEAPLPRRRCSKRAGFEPPHK